MPAPAAGAQAKFLRGDATWQTISASSSVMPNYSAEVSIGNISPNNTTTYTAPSNGFYRHYATDVTGSVYVNDKCVDQFSWSHGGWAGHAGCSLLLSAGDVVKIQITGGSGNLKCRFYPFKGA